MNVDSDLLSILKKGSLQGYFSDPHSTVCSRMCGTPVLSMGVVLNCTLTKQGKKNGQGGSLLSKELEPKHWFAVNLKRLLESSLAAWRY